jgi:anti-anti-sigma factor
MFFSNPLTPPSVGAERDDFALRVCREADDYVVAVYGDLDFESAQLMSRKIQEGQDSGGGVVVDLSGLDFVTTAGMDALVVADARAQGNGLPLVLLRAPDDVHQIFARAGLADRLPFIG